MPDNESVVEGAPYIVGSVFGHMINKRTRAVAVQVGRKVIQITKVDDATAGWPVGAKVEVSFKLVAE